MMVPRGDLSMYRSLLLLVMRTQSLPVHGTHICTYVHPPMDAKTHMYICACIWLKEDIQFVLLDSISLESVVNLIASPDDDFWLA